VGFKQRRAKVSEAPEPAKDAAQFRHSSGATDLEGLLGVHTLDDEAEVAPPKGYRARSVAKTEARK
jgi:hypothetical protein